LVKRFSEKFTGEGIMNRGEGNHYGGCGEKGRKGNTSKKEGLAIFASPWISSEKKALPIP